MTSKLDVIVPIYNEEDNLKPLVERIDTSLSQAKIAYSIIFIDDHSTDKSRELLAKLAKRFPIKVLTKAGHKGKAYSIIEGSRVATAPYLAMIDADLQYPPEVLPDMLRLTQQHGVIVARRNEYEESVLRKVISRGFRWFFGKLLYGLECDVQSGLKVFKKEIIDHVPEADVSPWTLDIPLLSTALRLGFSIGQVDITFGKREKGESKIEFVSSIREIGGRAIAYKLKRKYPFTITPDDQTTMVGAGLIHKGKTFITHTTLQANDSALNVLTLPQKAFIYLLLGFALAFLLVQPLGAAKLLVGILSFVYFIDVIFNLYLILKSLHQPPEISIPESTLAALKDKDLPIYTILCPLYKEAHVLPHFLDAIAQIEWPKNKLDVILLLEADDVGTIEAARAMNLPSYVSIQVVPDSQPKTKPKACNYGLHFAKGEYLVIYDAEDSPDPLQLKKVFAAFRQSPANVKCIQAKLNFYNPHQNLLTRFFTAEYSLWFDVVLTGLQSIQTSIPLGGTSNHFKTSELKALEGWDPFNVTEDCDLGIRLFQRGGVTAVIDSVTLEEANSSWHNWLRQRSRWIKGYMQTYLVHMRHPVRFFRQHGMHALLFQLVVGGKISFMLINPVMWLLTITYFGLYAWVGPAIESLYPSIVFYMAVTSLIFGNFMFLYYYMIGAAKREHWSVIKWVFLVPVYWLMVSLAAAIALYQLIVKPHYWEKTVHGLHLKKKELEKQSKALAKEVTAEVASYAEAAPTAATQSLKQSHADLTIFGMLGKHIQGFTPIRHRLQYVSLSKAVGLLKQPTYASGIIFLGASVVANILNMITSFYLGKHLSFADFGLFNLMMSLFYFTAIPIQALASTINYQSSFLLGKYKLTSLRFFWRYIHIRVLFLAGFLTVIWTLFVPLLPDIFNTTSALPFFIFGAVWLANLSFSTNAAYLNSRLLFLQVALLIIVQTLIRLLAAVVLVHVTPVFTFVSLIIALYIAAGLSYVFARRGDDHFVDTHEFHLPRPYYFASLITGLSAIAFFSLDNLVIAHLMGPEDVGRYAFMGLFGKMVFFVGNLTSTFLAPIVARKEGANQQTKLFFYLTLMSVVLMTGIGYLTFILGPYYFGELVYGHKVLEIRDELLLYGVGIACFTLAQIITSYHLLKKHYFFPIIALVLSSIQIISLFLFHGTLHQVTVVMTSIGILHLVTFVFLHWQYRHVVFLQKNLEDLKGLFQKLPRRVAPPTDPNALKILIFNWRDTRHVWAGGAEVYTQNIAQRLVDKGHKVTVFCGNDGKSPRNEVINGVQVIRRGGFYTIYIWAFLYYVLKLRPHYDVVIDCENGIPFLTPLFVKQPIFLLIYHVHRDVFTEHLPLPLALIARTIEEVIMPLIYRERPILTISESSKKEILNLGISHPRQITIVHPGIELPPAKKYTKTTVPSLCYVGRLKAYKNVDVLIKAFKMVLADQPRAILKIAGSGETESDLKKLVKDLGIDKSVAFLGKVSEAEKTALYATSWLAVQPSMIEGWGITVIEANAVGTPVVASNVKGLRDSVVENETGILVKSGDVPGFALAIKKLLKNKKQLSRFSLAARNWSQRFSWDQAAEEMETAIVSHAHYHTQHQASKLALNKEK